MFAYVAALAVVVGVVMVAAAALRTSSGHQKVRSLTRANVVAAVSVGIGIAGSILLRDAWAWGESSPTANAVISGVIVALAGGAGGALLPALSIVLLRRNAPVGSLAG
jgi:hypothetical protein